MEKIPNLTQTALYNLVTEQISNAQKLDDDALYDESAIIWASVSFTEEDITRLSDISEAELQIAQRGAVAAALKAGDEDRAQNLARQFGLSDAF
jgi:hypothetical protein